MVNERERLLKQVAVASTALHATGDEIRDAFLAKIHELSLGDAADHDADEGRYRLRVAIYEEISRFNDMLTFVG
ncbi:hypothetical protein ACC764_08535 [Rhizobium ruizarguesonis]|nr:hypothetical protein [Rhizobium ruizarguesonis]TBC98792.1 hypothetical protein ELH25_08865 [Rhizobium ruizarguesonis]TBD15627.1 hypothetical protein ELH24_08820 [Rhizobium ruizarguesonis]TBE96658.1 hypothetical protein ELG98_08675 [Rhizobium ruizarguesonis]